MRQGTVPLPQCPGLSKSFVTGPFSPVAVGSYEDKWYLDADFSWFYDLASISTRITVNAPENAGSGVFTQDAVVEVLLKRR
jgi:hypothetical protein